VTTVLLVGAGAVGARCARQLVETPGIDRLLICDRDAERAAEVARAMGPFAAVQQWEPEVDLPPGVDVVACALPAELDVAIARAAMDAGVPWVSAGDVGEGLHAVQGLDPAARAAGVPMVVGAGLAPGLADVLARHAADALESVDEIGISRAGAAGPSSAITARRSLQQRPAEIRDGAYQEYRRRGGHELVWFPDPVSARECQPIAAGVDLLGAAFPDVARVSVRLSPPDPGPRFSWPRQTDTEGSWGALRVEVWGRRGVAREPIVYGVIERTATAVGTVLALTAAGLGGALPDVVRREAGVHGLSAVAPPRAFLAELARRGVKAAVFEGVPVA
jgi:hypothetical protein